MYPTFYAFFVGLLKVEVRHCVNGWQSRVFNSGVLVCKNDYFETAEFAEQLGRDFAQDSDLYGIQNNH